MPIDLNFFKIDSSRPRSSATTTPTCAAAPLSALYWKLHLDVVNLRYRLVNSCWFTTDFTARRWLFAANHDNCEDYSRNPAATSQERAYNDFPTTTQVPIDSEWRNEVSANA